MKRFTVCFAIIILLVMFGLVGFGLQAAATLASTKTDNTPAQSQPVFMANDFNQSLSAVNSQQWEQTITASSWVVGLVIGLGVGLYTLLKIMHYVEVRHNHFSRRI